MGMGVGTAERGERSAGEKGAKIREEGGHTGVGGGLMMGRSAKRIIAMSAKEEKEQSARSDEGVAKGKG